MYAHWFHSFSEVVTRPDSFIECEFKLGLGRRNDFCYGGSMIQKARQGRQGEVGCSFDANKIELKLVVSVS